MDLRQRVFIVLSLLVFVIHHSACHNEQELDAQVSEVGSEPRKSKNFFPFVWVTFDATPCGTANDGTCVQRGKCTKRGGTVNGNCQNAFGECCMFTAMCNASRSLVDITQQVTVLESPTPSTTACTFRFRKTDSENICQIKLQFVSFSMEKANENGDCSTDRLRITNSETVANGFTTCGVLTGQHMYLSYGSQDTIEVMPLIRAGSSNYKIVATKIPCNSNLRAPDECLQYYTEPTNMVRSFDFRSNGQQQNNQRYNICVRPTTRSEQIEWKKCAGTENQFFITGPIYPMGPPPMCQTDWVQVYGQERQCNTDFADTISPWKPYNLLVNFDGNELPLPPVGGPVTTDPPAGSDPAACDTHCMMFSNADYDCLCSGDNKCQCSPKVPPMNPPSIDLANTGFCLEYAVL